MTIEEHWREGYILLQQRNYQGAIKEYDLAIRLDPKDAYAYINRGTAIFSNTLRPFYLTELTIVIGYAIMMKGT